MSLDSKDHADEAVKWEREKEVAVKETEHDDSLGN